MSVVYFIRMGVDGPIKIGTAIDARKRLAGLDNGPYPLRLIGTIPGNQPLEKRIHRALVRHRLRLEWFKPVPEVIQFMDGALADPSAVPALIAKLTEELSAHREAIARDGECAADAANWALARICAREGVDVATAQAGVTYEQVRKYRLGKARMSVVTFARLRTRWPEDFALFELILGVGHLTPEEVRANRATLENARDTIEAQLAKLVKAA